MIKIDGSFLEGGGQILRTSLALSTLLQEPCKIVNIRSGREQSGLKAQHLTCIRALKSICNAKALGDELGSEEVTFVPGIVKPGRYEFDIGTAGSVTLVLQSLIIPLMFADDTVTVVLRGGTNVKGAMPVDYLQNVLIPQLSKFCEKIECRINRRGYFPVGKGEIEFSVTPIVNRSAFEKFEDFLATLKTTGQKINLIEPGTAHHITGISHASNHLSVRRVAERQASAAELELKSLKLPVNIKLEYALSESVGSGISLFAHYVNANDEIDPAQPVVIGVDMLGEQRIESENIGRKCAERLVAEISFNSPVDDHLADNLVPFIGLYGGKFRTSSISDHTKTNMYVVEQFIPVKFMIQDNIITTMPI